MAFVIITNYLSGGTVNNPGGGNRVPTMPPMPPIWIGILFVILSTLIILWHRPGFNRARNPKSPQLTVIRRRLIDSLCVGTLVRDDEP